jgi:hypothetical protein
VLTISITLQAAEICLSHLSSFSLFFLIDALSHHTSFPSCLGVWDLFITARTVCSRSSSEVPISAAPSSQDHLAEKHTFSEKAILSC